MTKLGNSYFLKRIVLLLVIALFLWAFFTSLLYDFITRPTIIDLKVKDLLPPAEWISGNLAYPHSELQPGIDDLIKNSHRYLSLWTYVFYDHNITDLEDQMTELPNSMSQELRAHIHKTAYEMHEANLRGNPIKSKVCRMPDHKEEHLVVSSVIPNLNAITSDEGPLGTVIMIQPLTELNVSVFNLNIAVLLSSILVGLFLIIPVIFAATYLVDPLNRIRNVAMAITRGDFSQKAEVRGVDEVSDLGRAINHMSGTLSTTLRQLSLDRNQLKQIIDGIAEGIVAMDAGRNITQVNHMVWKIFKQNRQQVTPEELVRISGIEGLFKECFKSKAEVIEVIQIPDEEIRIRCHVSPILDNNENILTVVCLLRDVTESERLEQTRRDYIANVSHELRTPLTAMRGLLEPIRDGLVKREEDKQRYLGILIRETIRLSRLIGDMLELSRLQSGSGTALKQAPLDTELFLPHMCDIFSSMVEDFEIQFIFSRPEIELPMIWSKSDRLEQILIIFFDNAIKFTPIGGTIEFAVKTSADELTFSIHDTGPGIDPSDLPYLFERFYKADKAHNQKGTGLGLFIAKTLADKMGMKIGVNSVHGQGSTFYLKVRYASAVLAELTNAPVLNTAEDHTSEGGDSLED